MLNNVSYEKFIASLNSFEIKKLEFSITGYPHYKKCTIITEYDILNNGNRIPLICVHLTDDGTEDVSFYKRINENYKMFDLGQIGKFTLKQLWHKIAIVSIQYT